MNDPLSENTGKSTATDVYGHSSNEDRHATEKSEIKSANWHLTDRCNYSCKFCFMNKLAGREADLATGKEIILLLKKAGITKLNFVGGEPLLHPYLKDFAAYAKENGLTVSMVTNGYLLTEDMLRVLKPTMDWIGVSIDSANEDIEVRLGRGFGNHVKNCLLVCKAIKEYGIKLKINTVVTKLNFDEDLRPLIAELQPFRWKVFQMLGILGQNERYFAELETTKEEFGNFKKLNGNMLLGSGSPPVFEAKEDMVDSYFMLAPDGSVIQNTNHEYTYHNLEKVLTCGLSEVVDERSYLARGGKYDW